MRLIQYESVNEAAYISYIEEWEATGELIVPNATKRDEKTFTQKQEVWAYGETEAVYEKGRVPATLYFMVDEDDKVMGAVHLRHTLNEALRMDGGHIGYGIVPSLRRRGYGALMLKLLLEEVVKPMGIDKVLITCNESNTASQRTIELNGGILDEAEQYPGHLRYWITL